jgi:hypothetical protein
MARSRDISKVLSSNTTLATDAEVAATYQTKASAGLTLLTPTSIANTSGTASIGTNGTVSFSGASTVSLNGVFSSTYDNYKIIINHTNFTSDGYRFLRLRSSSTDLATGTYGYALAGINTSGTNFPLNTGATTFWNIGDMDSATDGTYSVSFDIHNPFLALKTNATYVSVSSTTAGVFFSNAGGGNNTNAISYDGFSVLTSAGNMSGTIYTYGYNK